MNHTPDESPVQIHTIAVLCAGAALCLVVATMISAPMQTGGLAAVVKALPTVTLKVTDSVVKEEKLDAATLTLTRTGSRTAALTVTLVATGTAARNTDYVLSGGGLTSGKGTVAIPAGAASVTIKITPKEDTVVEGAENIIIRIAAGEYTVGTENRVVLSLQDNDVATLRLGGLVWQPGINNTIGGNYLTTSDPSDISHTLDLISPTDPKKKVTLGFNENGGGYLWSAKMFGFTDVSNGRETGTYGYGRGMLGSIRDSMHHGSYNPVQSGSGRYVGVKTKVVKSEGSVLVPQFPAPLFNDQEFSYSNEKSDFDFSALTKDISNQAGTPAFSQEEYYVFARNPGALTQFLTGKLFTGPYAGEKILDNAYRIRDISPYVGQQKPTETDMSYIVQTVMGIRPRLDFKFLHYRSGGQWVSKDVTPSLANEEPLRCAYLVPGGDYIYDESGKKVTGPKGGDCVLDYPFYVLSTNIDPTKGSAQGLYIPMNDSMNTAQTKVVDGKKLSVERAEDRRINLFFTVSKTLESPADGPGFVMALARSNLTGLLSPATATTHYGHSSYEVLTQKTIVLYGTPEQIFQGVLKIPPGGPVEPSDVLEE